MAVNKLCAASAVAISKVPTVSMLAAIMGMPSQSLPPCTNLNFLTSDTSERELSVERFGRIITSLKPSFISDSIRILYYFVFMKDKQLYWNIFLHRNQT